MPDVPCNGCTLCCKGDAVRLLPWENPALYDTEEHPYVPGMRMLAHKANRDCVYLTDSGCSIHERRPQQCRDMDCRVVAKTVTFLQAQSLSAQGRFPLRVWRRGKELLKESS